MKDAPDLDVWSKIKADQGIKGQFWLQGGLSEGQIQWHITEHPSGLQMGGSGSWESWNLAFNK